MSSSGTPIAGTDHHEDDHAPYASLVPATAHALAIGDERVPLNEWDLLLPIAEMTLNLLRHGQT
jgi:hypothetical protein